MRNHLYLPALLTVVVLACIAGIPSATSATGHAANATRAAGPSGSLFYSTPTAYNNLDPDLQASGPQGMLYDSLLYDTLVFMRPNGTLEPLLATSWKVGSDSNGLYCEFTLRKGLRFPDGAPFNSTTVAVRIKRAKLIPGSLTLADVSGVTVRKMGTYVVRLYSPNALALPALMAGPAGMMISQKGINGNWPLATKPDGIGMYSLTNFTPGLVTYKANPSYWDKSVQKIENITIAGNPDDNARLNLMRTKSVDLTYLNPALDSSAANLGYNLLKGPLLGTYNLAINTSVAPFNNVQVRRAMAMAIDRAGVNQSVLFGECIPTSQLYPVNSPAYDRAGSTISYDPATAKKLIASAGATGAKLTIIVQNTPTKFLTLVTAVQAEWEAIGLDVTIRAVPFAQVGLGFNQGQAAVAFVSAGSFADPSQAVATYLAPNALYNPGHFNDPVITADAAAALKQTDPAKRIRLYQAISARTTHTLSFIPVVSTVLYYWVSPKIKNFVDPITSSDIDWRDGLSVTQ